MRCVRRDDQTDAVLMQAKRALVGQGQSCAVTAGPAVDANGQFALWTVQNTACIQRLSDLVVNATYHLAKPNQKVPSWVMSLPPAERQAKIAMIARYGSPNVFSQFQPHITVAHDSVDNLTADYNQVAIASSFLADLVDISPVGAFGTVPQHSTLASIAIPSREVLPTKARLGRRSQSHSDSCRPSDSFSWDYLLLVREWPGTVSPGALPSYIDSFTLHGLWPNNNDGSYPQCCNNSYPFSYNQIAPIIQDVDRIWYDTLHDQANATSFWSHEWSKHGTCAVLDSAIGSDERAYFQTCINLHDQMTEAKWLAAAGIVPADPSQTLYKQSAFVDALQQGLGVAPLIKCSSLNGNNVIENLGVCLDKSLTIITCPYLHGWGNCDDEFGLPLIPH